MTPADLHAWIDARGLTHAEAARLLSLSVNMLRRRLYGIVPVGAQTARIIELMDKRADTERETNA